MSPLEAILLGFIQGLTEFIPISSSGHLIMAREVFGLGSAGGADLAVDAVLQLATALAILAYFARDLVKIFRDKTLVLAVILGTIPAIIFGLLLEEIMATAFRTSDLVALALLFGAGLMYLAERVRKQNTSLSARKGFFVGLFQALALIPGVSRSGATISGGLFLGLTREEAARFSFLLAFPIILGSGLKKLFDLSSTGLLGEIGVPLALGSLVAFLVGLGAIKFLLSYLKNHKLNIFIWYRVVLATAILLFI